MLTPDYARPSCIPTELSRRTLFLLLAAAILTSLAAFLLFHGPTGCQVRLDSGDLRYTFLGIPTHYSRLPTPERTALLALAKSAGVPAEWQWINFGGSSNPDGMCRDSFLRTAAFIPADPTIARFALLDNADFIRTRHWTSGPPEICALDFPARPNSSGSLTLLPTWKSDEDVQDFCRAHAYTLPP